MTVFKEGDKVMLDATVPGKVDGFYKRYVVFSADWKPGICIWGTLVERKADQFAGDPLHVNIKQVSLGKLIVHPSNLKLIKEDK